MGSRAFISHPLTDSKDSGTSRTDTKTPRQVARAFQRWLARQPSPSDNSE